MKKIGDKIKELRIKKGYTQDNILPGGQANVVQIENGSIKRPTEQTLNRIANELEINLDELVKDTDWEKGYKEVKETQYYAISRGDFDVVLDTHGKFSIAYKTYPLLNKNNEINKFCPISGTSLVIECEKCKRKIESRNYFFCSGCGKRLVESITYGEEVYEAMNSGALMDDEGIEYTIQGLSDLNVNINKEANLYERMLKNFKKVAYEDLIKVINKEMGFLASISSLNRYKPAQLCVDKKLDKLKLATASSILHVEFNLINKLIDCCKDRRKSSIAYDKSSAKEIFESNIYKKILDIAEDLKNPVIAKLEDKSFDINERIKVLNELSQLIGAPTKDIKDFINKDKKNEMLTEEDSTKLKTKAPKKAERSSK